MISLQSGSNGNCVYVESGNVRIFFDAGLSCSKVEERLAEHGRSALNADALFISHDHSDHVSCAGPMIRRFNIPMYVTQRTLAVSKRRMSLGDSTEFAYFRSGSAVKIKHITVETLRTPHDGVDGSVFVVDDGTCRLGICTDLGHVTPQLEELVASVDGLFLESNYDEHMLIHGNYPRSLKRRIEGPGGHISNLDAADLVAGFASSRLQWLCLAHLSQENNSPAIAVQTHRAVLGKDLTIHVGSRYSGSQVLMLEAKQAPIAAEHAQAAPREDYHSAWTNIFS